VFSSFISDDEHRRALLIEKALSPKTFHSFPPLLPPLDFEAASLWPSEKADFFLFLWKRGPSPSFDEFRHPFRIFAVLLVTELFLFSPPSGGAFRLVWDVSHKHSFLRCFDHEAHLVNGIAGVVAL